MSDSPDIVFSQYGQGFPTPSLSWHIPEAQQGSANKKSRARRECQKRKSSEQSACQSYVVNNKKKKGLRLIQVKVLDISENQEPASDNDEVIVLSAQYVVSEPVDNVKDETLSLINKISKKLCDDGY